LSSDPLSPIKTTNNLIMKDNKKKRKKVKKYIFHFMESCFADYTSIDGSYSIKVFVKNHPINEWL
jgi:hypothetical protein